MRGRPIAAVLLTAACAAVLLMAACAADTHLPPFARLPYEPFSAKAVVAIALREWRAFGSLTDPDASTRKPEREEGLWQRIGEYWWLGLDRLDRDAAWTGKHDARGRIFPPERDEAFAWSAAFISYVMRIAGAGAGFPYSASHDVYIRAALRPGLLIAAERPETYAPRPGDLICAGREEDAGLRFDDLPTTPAFKGHCDIVISSAGPDSFAVVGGNVADGVTMRQVPMMPDGRLASSGQGQMAGQGWLAVLRLRSNDLISAATGDHPPSSRR